MVRNCPMRHKNGNCLPAGGFCTAINEIICDALQKAYNAGKRDAYVVRPKSEWIVTIEEIEGTHCITPLYSKSRRRCQTKVNVECTKAQIVDIRLLFDFYTHLFNEEKDMFLTAFVHKHQLYGQPKPGDEKRQYSVDDLIKIRRFMDGMQDATPNKRIERS